LRIFRSEKTNKNIFENSESINIDISKVDTDPHHPNTVLDHTSESSKHLLQLGVSAQSLQFQNVTDPINTKLEKSQTETDLWQFRNQISCSLHPSLPPKFNSHLLSHSLPMLNGSLSHGQVNWACHPHFGQEIKSVKKKNFLSSCICPFIISLLAISATLAITLSILHFNYLENSQRKMSKKHPILNHWGKQKPVQADLDKLYQGDQEGGEKKLIGLERESNIDPECDPLKK